MRKFIKNTGNCHKGSRTSSRVSSHRIQIVMDHKVVCLNQSMAAALDGNCPELTSHST